MEVSDSGSLSLGKTSAAVTPRPVLSDPALDVMNFLNNIIQEFPEAISFAPGRPLNDTLDVIPALERAVRELIANDVTASANLTIGQYSNTNGIINGAIAEHLKHDEGINVDPAAIIVTVGAQEAMALIVAGLLEPATDVLLVSDPSYIGMSGLARILGVRVVPVHASDEGVTPATLEAAIHEGSKLGRVRAFYDIPDFNNPLGSSLGLAARRAILDVCRRHDMLIIEDNPYGMFNYDGPRLPTFKALDDERRVLYVGSFAKTLFPGLRVGFLVADQLMPGTTQCLAAALSRVKSLLTVNTSPVCQAIVASMIRQGGGSLEPIVAPKRVLYKRQRDAMIAALAESFKGSRVSWTTPTGGFFIPVSLPWRFGEAEVHRCASRHGVIVAPMQFFSVAASRRHQVRLSFSYVSPDQIRYGITRFADFVGGVPD
jgi:(S)-3,5-dihydroxyphenylglycine transaminase